MCPVDDLFQEPLEPTNSATTAEELETLLRAPIVRNRLPSGFNEKEEAAHIHQLIHGLPALAKYRFRQFVYAGGSGMVFRVEDAHGTNWALKIIRKKLLLANTEEGRADNLSPVSLAELAALEKLSHPNLVRLREAITLPSKGVVALITSYVDSPESLDSYFKDRWGQQPSESTQLQAYSPKRLNLACDFFAERLIAIADAIEYMHGQGIYHFDIKPANLLIGDGHVPYLTDMGSAIHLSDIANETEFKVYFTWTYAHPHLHSLLSRPSGLREMGLKASAFLKAGDDLAKYDLFALGRTIQEILGIFYAEFRELCFGCYGFRYLHFLSCLCLDGRNSPASDGEEPLHQRDDRYFVSDTALEYPAEIFRLKKITSAKDFADRMRRYRREFSWNAQIPELDPWQSETINCVVNSPAPFTERVAAVFNHSAVRRLKEEQQLGYMRELYPGATHNRWAHSIGVFSNCAAYCNSLLSDPSIPVFRILVDGKDIEHGLLAAMLHDVGQSSFGHDFEEACPELFQHEDLMRRILDEKLANTLTLRETIISKWGKHIDLERIIGIVKGTPVSAKDVAGHLIYNPVDGVIADIISGPLDADKLDYLLRDSRFCGVEYGRGIDRARFLQSLTVAPSKKTDLVRWLRLAYKAKGRSAIQALMNARTELYGAIYWHRTFRCMQAMFTVAANLAIGDIGREKPRVIGGVLIDQGTLKDLFYYRVVNGYSWAETREMISVKNRTFSKMRPFADAPFPIGKERALDLIWQLGDERARGLVVDLARRTLFKRIFELSVGELAEKQEYYYLTSQLTLVKRIEYAKLLQGHLIEAIGKRIAETSEDVTQGVKQAQLRFAELQELVHPLLLIDFPSRGVPQDESSPLEIGDSERKYFDAGVNERASEAKIFAEAIGQQKRMATVRIYAHPILHELIVRYLNSKRIRFMTKTVLGFLNM